MCRVYCCCGLCARSAVVQCVRSFSVSPGAHSMLSRERERRHIGQWQRVDSSIDSICHGVLLGRAALYTPYRRTHICRALNFDKMHMTIGHLNGTFSTANTVIEKFRSAIQWPEWFRCLFTVWLVAMSTATQRPHRIRTRGET